MSETTPLPRTLTPREAGMLVNQASPRVFFGLRNRCLLRLMVSAGLRAGEVVALKPEHLDPLARELHVHEGRGAMERVLRIDSKLRDLIVAWSDVRPDSVWLFPTDNGTQLDTRYLRRMVKRYATDAGVPEPEEVSPKTLRHTFAVEQLRASNDLEQLQRLLGHRHPRNTKVYADMLEAEREHARALEARLTSVLHSATSRGGTSDR